MNKNLSIIKKLWNSFIKENSYNNIIVFPKQYKKCQFCNSIAKWKHTYMNNQYLCDKCVPRDCSCILYEKSKRAIFSVENYVYLKNKICEDWEKLDQ